MGRGGAGHGTTVELGEWACIEVRILPIFSERRSVAAQLLLIELHLLLQGHHLLALHQHANLRVRCLVELLQFWCVTAVGKLHDILLDSELGFFLAPLVVEDQVVELLLQSRKG